MRPRRDIDDLDDSLFGREEAEARLRERAEARERAAERIRQEDERDRAAAERVRESTRDTNRRMILREYEARGLAPPSGALVSLSMLLRMGWTIEEVAGRATLVAPPAPEKYVAKGECT